MHFIKKRFGIQHLVVFFEDTLFQNAVANTSYPLITALSYTRHNLPGVRVREKDTALIDISPSPEHILASMHRTTRNEILRSLAKNFSVELRVGFHEDLYMLYASFERAQGRTPMKKDEFAQFRYVVVSLDNTPLSVVSLIEEKPLLRIRSIFSARMTTQDAEQKKNISNASRRAIYEACVWGHENGFTSLDLASVNITDANKAHLSKFKLSFGGTFRKEYTHIFATPAIQFVLKILSRVRS